MSLLLTSSFRDSTWAQERSIRPPPKRYISRKQNIIHIYGGRCASFCFSKLNLLQLSYYYNYKIKGLESSSNFHAYISSLIVKVNYSTLWKPHDWCWCSEKDLTSLLQTETLSQEFSQVFTTHEEMFSTCCTSCLCHLIIIVRGLYFP